MSGTAPKRRTSHSKKNKRRAHDALVPVNPTICSNCGEPVMPHCICRHCGFYRRRQMVAPATGPTK
ncbi:MAG: 50S ribosomal protein L32 [Candidatus Binataceae bacterium]